MAESYIPKPANRGYKKRVYNDGNGAGCAKSYGHEVHRCTVNRRTNNEPNDAASLHQRNVICQLRYQIGN